MGFDHFEVMQLEVIFFCDDRYGVDLCDLKQNLCSLPQGLLVLSSEWPPCTRTDFSLGAFLPTLGITRVTQVG